MGFFRAWSFTAAIEALDVEVPSLETAVSSLGTALLPLGMEWLSVEKRARLRAGDWPHDNCAAQSPGLDNCQ